jgi:hypothetical protein
MHGHMSRCTVTWTQKFLFHVAVAHPNFLFSFVQPDHTYYYSRNMQLLTFITIYVVSTEHLLLLLIKTTIETFMYIKALRDTLHFNLIFMPRIWEVPKRRLDRFQRQERRCETDGSLGVTTHFYGNHCHTVSMNSLSITSAYVTNRAYCVPDYIVTGSLEIF